jgi:hypothetical protein
VLNKEKPLSASSVGWRVFLFLHLRIQTAFDAPFEIKNPGATRQGFFFVAEGALKFACFLYIPLLRLIT